MSASNGVPRGARTSEKQPSAPLTKNFRLKGPIGLWCSLLMPVLLWCAFTGDYESAAQEHVKPPAFKEATLVLSCFLSLASMVIAYCSIFKSEAGVSKGGGNVVSFMMRKLVSDLFERQASREISSRRTQKTSASMSADSASEKASVGWLSVALVLVLVLTGSTVRLSLWALASLLAYCYSLGHVFRANPGSFTFGEGCLALQAAVLFAFEASASLLSATDDPSTISGSFAVIAKSGLLSCLFFCSLPALPATRWVGRSTYFLPAGLVALLGLVLPFLWSRLRRDPVSWVLELVFNSRRRTYLFGAWFLCVLAAVTVVGGQPESKRASTRVRKYFHLLVLFIHTSGSLVDPEFMYLATAVALGVFMLLEAMRAYKIQPYAAFLNNCLSLFIDDKDHGPLILSHIYLLAGCSLPLWISHDLSSESKVRLLSGVLSVGVGDSAASVVGSKVGRLRLPDSGKSVEGMAAAAAAQLLFLWALEAAALLPPLQWASLVLPVGAVALAEALTVQVDNLVLPILMYILL